VDIPSFEIPSRGTPQRIHSLRYAERLELAFIDHSRGRFVDASLGAVLDGISVTATEGDHFMTQQKTSKTNWECCARCQDLLKLCYVRCKGCKNGQGPRVTLGIPNRNMMDTIDIIIPN